MYYTEEQIIVKCENASKDMTFFYNADFVNYKGRTKEKRYYTEIVAQWLLDNMDLFRMIKPVDREKSYNTRHTGDLGEKTNRTEEYIAKQLFNTSMKENIIYPGFGKIIDYQTPLKANNDCANKGIGKIDLLSINEKEKSVFILELKKNDSVETMLRCVLESYTYSRIISREKLYSDFKIPKDYIIKASPLVFLNGCQHQEYVDPNRIYLHRLMNVLNSTPFFIEDIPTKFRIYSKIE